MIATRLNRCRLARRLIRIRRHRPAPPVIMLLSIAATLWIVSAAISTPLRAETLVLRNGEKINQTFSYKNDAFVLADGRIIPRNDVTDVFMVSTGNAKTPSDKNASGNTSATSRPTGAAAEKVTWPPDIEKAIADARVMAKKYPGNKGVLILDHGKWTVQNDGTRTFRYHFLGLVLKEDARDEWQTVGGWFEEGRSMAKIIMARSIDPDGTIHTLDPATMKVSTPKENSVYFNKRARNLRGVIPGVNVGSLVEYEEEWRYTLPEQKRLFAPGWRFQDEIPVVSSVITIDLPDPLAGDLAGLAFQYVTKNMPEKSRRPVIEKKDGRIRYTWRAENIPPVVPEPSMVALSDVIMRLECTLYPDWKELNEYNARIQSERIAVKPPLKQLADTLTKNAPTVDEKIARLYHWVQQNITYNSIKSSRSSGWSGHPAIETFEKKYGDCTDVSILFCTLLKAIDITAYPVILRTSDSGETLVDIPAPDGNHCITQVVKPDGKSMFLDCTSDSYSYPYFRADDHGVWTINFIKGKIERTPVPPPEDNMKQSELHFVLDKNANAVVTETNSYTGSYEAGVRGYWQSVPPDRRKEFMQRYLARRQPGAVLTQFKTSDLKDLMTPLKMTLTYTVPKVGSRAGDLLIVKVEQLERAFSADTALESRKYPIENYTTRAWKRRWVYDLPAGFSVKSLPDPITIDTKHVTYKASMTSDPAHRRVIVKEWFSINTRQVPVSDYPAYRNALNRVARWSKNYIFLQINSASNADTDKDTPAK